MSFKSWILNKMTGVAGRPDLPRSPVLSTVPADIPSVIRRDSRRGARGGGQGAMVPPTQHLGPYAALIGAIREELEQFVLSYLNLHLAIAERDRYLLTSIEVTATAPEDDELLRRFIREFKPEQIKRYLAREVIAGLPNASALDLSQFAGLNAARAEDAEDRDDDYSELLAELRGADSTPGLRRFEVALIGRWSEIGTASLGASSRHVPGTPLPGPGVEVRIEDADGARHATLAPVVPGRRYSIGKDETCDVVVNGEYASRRHCEIWLDRGSWWVTDAGSTNGLRVERAGHVLGRSGADAAWGPGVIELVADARIVLSARAEGGSAEYPRLALEAARVASSVTPVAPVPPLRATPSTPILAKRKGEFTISAQMASGARTIELHSGSLPVSVGRSRSQTLVVDWTHEGVSGHHLSISAMDPAGVTVEVHGDNGVTIAGTAYAQGAHLRWRPGEALVLGRTIGREPECRLTLARQE